MRVPKLRVSRVSDAGGKHANDRKGALIEAQLRPAYDAWVSGEISLPDRMTKDDDRVLPERFVRGEPAAEGRVDPQHLKQVRRRSCTDHLLRARRSDHGSRPLAHPCD